MLSIAIPIYNYHCSELIQTLHTQGLHTMVPFEIICLDDGSDPEYRLAHEKLEQLEHVRYLENGANMGRSQTRNKLARIAQFPFLLYLDCDSKLTTNSFVRNYMNVLEDNTVYYGGRIYSETVPLDPSKWLHWKYGHEREARNLTARQRNPYLWFHSNNFIIPRHLFLDIPMDERLLQYGYEDSLLAAELRDRKIPLQHLDNPVIHLGLIDNDEFLVKARLAVQNLHGMLREGHRPPVRLVSGYRWLHRLGLAGYFRRRFEKHREAIEDRLTSGQGSLRDFDRYRLGYLLSLD